MTCLVEHEDLVDSAVVLDHVLADADGGHMDGLALLTIGVGAFELQVDEHDRGWPHLRQVLQRLVGINLADREREERIKGAGYST